jgi:hypothetical protein
MAKPSASVSIKGLPNLKKKLEGVVEGQEAQREMRAALIMAGLVVQTEARRLVQKSPRGGVTYEKYNPRRTHTASAAGEPPATDTGMLVNAITVVPLLDRLSVVVKVAGALAPYSLPLEFGTADGKIKPRPFLRPALEARGAAASAIIASAVKKLLAKKKQQESGNVR